MTPSWTGGSTSHEDTPEVTRVARDLTAITELAADLEDQATHTPGNGTQMPGGDAMAMLAPGCSLEAWEHRIETAERVHYEVCERDSHADCAIVEHIADQNLDAEPPLQMLLFWTEQLRVEHNRETDARPTLASETGFLRQMLDWVWQHEPRFDDLAADVHIARTRLENTLRAGDRPNRTHVLCDNPGCEARPLLVKVHMDRVADDYYRCPACKHRYDKDGLRDAYAHQLRSEGADRYVRKTDALAALRDIGRPERTIRKWLAAGSVGTRRDSADRVWVWWPDLWRLHRDTQLRERVA